MPHQPPLPTLFSALLPCSAVLGLLAACATDAPSRVVATVLSSTAARIEWRENSSTESGFFIQRRTGSGAA